MNEVEFKARTKDIAGRIMRHVDAMKSSRAADAVSRQIVRSGTSIGANYRAACRAKSVPDMMSKLAIVEEEADETIYWLELLEECELVKPTRLAKLKQDVGAIVAMTVTSIKTLRCKTNPKSKI